MKPQSILTPIAISIAMVSCENPADNTTTATTTDAETPTTTAAGEAWKLHSSSTLSFIGSKVTGSHDGGFKSISGQININDQDEVTGGTITIDMDSTWSDNDKLTEHLKAPDFFDVANFPTSTFVITQVSQTGDTSYNISGNLEMRGVEKNITFPASGSKEGEAIKVQAEFDINRKDWGIAYEGKKDDLIRDEVVLKMDLTLTAGE